MDRVSNGVSTKKFAQKVHILVMLMLLAHQTGIKKRSSEDFHFVSNCSVTHFNVLAMKASLEMVQRVPRCRMNASWKLTRVSKMRFVAIRPKVSVAPATKDLLAMDFLV